MTRVPRPDDLRLHQEWIGYLQPVGLVVAAAALANAGVAPDRDAAARQPVLDALAAPDADGARTVDSFPRLTVELLGWQPDDLVPEEALPDALAVPLPEYGDVLRPTWAVRDPDAADRGEANEWLLLVQEVPPGTPFDEAPAPDRAAGGWRAAPQARLERLLRETGVAVGLLTDGRRLRLVYAPRGESSGHATWVYGELLAPAGRPMLAALHMLLSAERLFVDATARRLPALLRDSRRYQNDVSTRLADQVLGALYELTRGFQVADDLARGELLGVARREAPEDVYGGLLTTLLRLVFVLYAEDRGLLPGDPLYVQHYSVAGLFERLREDDARYPDTMDQRYGAWAQLLALFRMLHDGARSGAFHVPPRHGRLFDPDAYPFLEGRPHGTRRVTGDAVTPPRVSDGCVWRVLRQLLMLDGDRLSYRALDVEQIGSVYEAIMGFALVEARGTSVAVVPKTRKPGSPSHPVVDLDALLALPGAKRKDQLKAAADCELPPAQAAQLAAARTVDDLVAALGRRLSPFTHAPVPPGAMLLEPTEERRRSGSHYTPRSLTEPIVRTTLEPVLAAFGEHPRAEQILDLAVCDPAMGSGAFLVEACRYLGDAVVAAWQRHGGVPELPADEDPQLAARRLVAQRCLYGVDRNPFAVDLAKLSLWLVTLAREHPFTFVDHALRHGDSLVGFTRRQIEAFHWGKPRQLTFVGEQIGRQLREAERLRFAIEAMGDTDDVRAKARLLREADEALSDVRLVGDALAAAFFAGTKPKERDAARAEFEGVIEEWLAKRVTTGDVRAAVAEALDKDVRRGRPFHWEAEFPEVFDRNNPGFDAFVGNPPFMGGSKISTSLSREYSAYLTDSFAEAHGKSDLVAYFVRRAFQLTRKGGCLGLIATNTVRQGATRSTGLRWLRAHGGQIYNVVRRLEWPGVAAVVVSVVHAAKAPNVARYTLDGAAVPAISAYLLPFGPDDDPARLTEMQGLAFSGINPNGKGFVLTAQQRDALLRQDPRGAAKIFPYLGSVEMNESVDARPTRSVIAFGDVDEDFVQEFPALHQWLFDTVRVQRKNSSERRLKERWWTFSRPASELSQALKSKIRVLVNGRVATHHTFTFQDPTTVFSDAVTVFLFDTDSAFAVLQSRVHELWAQFQGSSFKDDPRYIPEDCFETFGFPAGWNVNTELDRAGRRYYDCRASVMLSNGEGLTDTYNRFHDRDEHSPGIVRLRELHAEMDCAVLTAYGWGDIDTRTDFFPEHDDEDDAEPASNGRARRRRFRLRWPDPVRDEVLARLLELNRRRAAGLPDRDPVVVPAFASPSAAPPAAVQSGA